MHCGREFHASRVSYLLHLTTVTFGSLGKDNAGWVIRSGHHGAHSVSW